jgi:hypothetical protein
VDTPGTNAVIRRHEELTRDFVPRSDLVLFITSADRPFTESERAFLEQIREWGKKVVFIVNKVDILRTPQERDEVVTFVRDNATALLGEPPEIFPVSAREAQAARADAGDEAKWEHSGFGAVEHYLLRTLDQEERVRLKLLSPLNVGLRLAQRYKDAAFERLKLLADDVEAIANIDRQLTAFHQEMVRDLDPRLARLDLLLGEMEGRGIRFFDETIRLGRIRTLLDSEGVKRAFAHEVVADTPQEIETEVGKVIDWIVERNLRVWQDIQSYVTRQASRHREGMIGEVGSSFSYNRQALLNSVGRVSRDVIGSYDREGEARAIANDVQGTFATAALAEAGAVGIGTMVATLLTGVAADVTGIVLAAALAIGGFYLIPRRRRQAQEAFRARVADLRNRLKQGLNRQAHHEIGQATERVNEAIAPYRRFVETQQTQLNEARGELVAVEDTLLRLKSEIERR